MRLARAAYHFILAISLLLAMALTGAQATSGKLARFDEPNSSPVITNSLQLLLNQR